MGSLAHCKDVEPIVANSRGDALNQWRRQNKYLPSKSSPNISAFIRPQSIGCCDKAVCRASGSEAIGVSTALSSKNGKLTLQPEMLHQPRVEGAKARSSALSKTSNTATVPRPRADESLQRSARGRCCSSIERAHRSFYLTWNV